MSLNTSRILRRRAWTVLPMPQSVIDRVNAMAADQPRLITFVDKHGIEIGDIGDDPDTINPPETQYEIPGVIADILRSQEWIQLNLSKIQLSTMTMRSRRQK